MSNDYIIGYGLLFEYGNRGGKSISSTTTTVESKCPSCKKTSKTNFCPDCGTKIEHIITSKSKKFSSYYDIFLDRYNEAFGQYEEDIDLNGFTLSVSDETFLVAMAISTTEDHTRGTGDYYDTGTFIFATGEYLSKEEIFERMNSRLETVLGLLPENMKYKLVTYMTD